MLDDNDINITMTMSMSSSISVSSSSTTTSILRQGPSNDINFISSMSTSSSSSLSSCNSRRRRRSSSSSSASVHFPPDDTIVTSIHTRPRTDKEDIPKLYYSSLQIRYFKQKYKDQHLFASYDCDKHHHRNRSTKHCTDGEQQSISSDDSTNSTVSSSSSEDSSNLTCVISSLQRQHDASKKNDTTKTTRMRQSRSTPRPDSSFWRTKVNWRWQSSSSTRKNTTGTANRASSSGSDRFSSYSRRDQVVGVGSSHSYLLN